MAAAGGSGDIMSAPGGCGVALGAAGQAGTRLCGVFREGHRSVTAGTGAAARRERALSRSGSQTPAERALRSPVCLVSNHRPPLPIGAVLSTKMK